MASRSSSLPLLQFSNFSLDIGDEPILKSLDFEIRSGQTLGIVGESGSGKSMTALSALQLLPENSRQTGSLSLMGRELKGLDDATMSTIRGRQVAMIFQEPMTALNPVKTIGLQIAETLRYHTGISRSDGERKTIDLLQRVGLPPSKVPINRFPHQLSGGQRQRVVIAIALALKPRLLIADEPTTALDVTTQAKILKLIQDLTREEDMTTLLISHDLGVVAQMVDDILIMKQGEIVERGPITALQNGLSHPYSQQLLKAATITLKPRDVAPDAHTLLETHALSRQYKLPRKTLFQPARYLQAVDTINLHIKAGENVGIVGESGCGKSTLSRMIMALDKPTHGRVEFEGKDLFALPKHQLRDLRSDMQIVFQDPFGSFNPRHKISRLVGEPLHLLPDLTPQQRRTRVVEALEQVGIDEAALDHFPHEFSGGQRQRIAIARAIVTRPKLIVADEPVSALDVSIREQVLALIGDLGHRLGIAFLFISHDLNVVRAVSHRVYVMLQGKIVETGPTEQVFNNPSNPYTRQLLQATPVMDDVLNRRFSQEYSQ